MTATIEELKELEDYKHKLRMEELQFERSTNTVSHQQAMERHRVTNAEEKKRAMMHHQHRVAEIELRAKLYGDKKNATSDKYSK